MKHTFLLLHLLILTITDSVAADAPEPPSLQQERQIYQREWDAATQPVLRRYLKRLELLKGSAMKTSNLQSAVAVQREIELMTAKIAQINSGAIKDLLAQKHFRFIRPGQTNPVLTLLRDGTIRGSDHPNESLWDINAAGQLCFKHPDGHITSLYDRQVMQNGFLRFEEHNDNKKSAKLRVEEVDK